MTANQGTQLAVPRPGIRSRARSLLETGKTVEQTCAMTGLDRHEVAQVAAGQGWNIDTATGMATVTRRATWRHPGPPPGEPGPPPGEPGPRPPAGQPAAAPACRPPGQSCLSGSLCVQRGTPVLQAFAPIAMLVAHASIDTYDPSTGHGYQRALSTARIPKVAAYYELGGRMVNAIMANIRDRDFPGVTVTATQGGQEAFERAVAEGGNWTGAGEVRFPDSVRLWVYDGQHRKAALAHLLKNYEEDFADFPVPVGITLGLPASQETREFYEVNTNVVNVQTDLAWTLLAGLASRDADLRTCLEASGKEWITRGSAVVAALTRMEGPWQGRFQLANSRKRKGDGATIRKAQFIRSLRPVLEAPVFRRASPGDIAAVINSYWIGISNVIPEPFAGDPSDYVIQKGIGVSTLHQILPQAIEIARSKGHKLADPAAYADVMSGLTRLSGHAIIDGRQIPRQGAEFWRSKSAATGFSGNTGRHRLTQLLHNIMPPPENTDNLY
jgi:DGQHR domain-containing protein